MAVSTSSARFNRYLIIKIDKSEKARSMLSGCCCSVFVLVCYWDGKERNSVVLDGKERKRNNVWRESIWEEGRECGDEKKRG